jgi:hypothetical protein
VEAGQSGPARRKRTWRSQVIYPVLFSVTGVFCLVLAALRWKDLGLLPIGVVNLTAGAYFARDLWRRRRAEQVAANAEPVAAPDRPGG